MENAKILTDRQTDRQTSLFSECYQFVQKKPWYLICTTIVLFLAYGFYCTHYTLNLDLLVGYRDGNIEITQGRWIYTLIHLISNWTAFSPFWYTFVAIILFALSALIWVVLFYKISSYKLHDKALLSFGVIFPVYPIISEQITYITLGMALAYVLIPILIWILYQFIFEGNISISKIVTAIILMVISIDLSESFAPVFLTAFFAVLILNWIFTDRSKKLKFYFVNILKVILFLAISIAIDFVVSKMICYIASGSFDYWYANNTSTNWFKYGGLIDSIVWFLRSVFASYIIMGCASISILLFDIAIVISLVIAVVISVKNKTTVPIFLTICLDICSVSLSLILCKAPLYRNEQAIPIFVAFVFMLFIYYSDKKKVLSYFAVCCLILTVLLETQYINNYAVQNYERFEYETKIMREIGDELNHYDTENKPVVFISNNGAKLLPESILIPRKSKNIIYNNIRQQVCKIWDCVLPSSYYSNMDMFLWPYADIEVTDCDSLIQAIKASSIIYTPFLSSATDTFIQRNDFYIAMDRLGYKIKPFTKKEQKKAKKYLEPDIKGEYFNIKDIDSMIIVQLMNQFY